MWSHYAGGHKGVVLEVEVPDDHPDLCQVLYSPFLSVFTEKLQTKEDMRHLFNGKGEEWAYEQECRIITDQKFFELSGPVSKVFLGPMINEDHEKILRTVIGGQAQILAMELDRTQVTLSIKERGGSVPRTDSFD